MTTENNTVVEPTAEELAAKATAEAAATAAALNQPKDAVLPTPAADEPDAKGVVTYNPTGDAGLDMLLESVGNIGLGPDHAAVKAAVEGDFTLLAAEMAKKEVKGHDRLIALGEKAFKDIRGKTEAKQAEDLKAVHGEVGGPEAWADIQKWVAANGDDGEKKAISSALGKGGLEARMAASWLRTTYDKANNITTEGEGKPVSQAKGEGASGNGALNSREYAKEVASARVGFKGDFESSSVYKALQARRLAYRG